MEIPAFSTVFSQFGRFSFKNDNLCIELGVSYSKKTCKTLGESEHFAKSIELKARKWKKWHIFVNFARLWHEND